MKRFDYKKWVVEKKYSKLLLTEQEAEEKPKEDSSGLIDISAGPEAILQAAAKIPQKTLYAGRTDGKPDDEKIQINPDSATANTLIPTQNAIGSAQSLDDQITDKSYGGSSQLDQALNDDKISSQTGTFPILTFDKKYILDGHHRWSQFMASNPNQSVAIADISAPEVDNADEALALTHVILFALYGKSPTKPFKGENLVGKDEKWIKDYVMKGIVDSAIQKLHKAGKIDKPDKESAANYYAKNLAGLPGGSHDRLAMPQGGDAGDPTGLTVAPQPAAAGVVNYNNPKHTDYKKGHKYSAAAQESKNTKKTIMKKFKDPRHSLFERMETYINPNHVKTEAIVDPVQDRLSDVFEDDGSMKSKVVGVINKGIESIKKQFPDLKITDYFVVGAAVTYQYQDKSDIDTTVVIDPETPDELMGEADKWIEANLDAKEYHNKRPYQFKLSKNDRNQLQNVDSAWDVKKGTWIKKPDLEKAKEMRKKKMGTGSKEHELYKTMEKETQPVLQSLYQALDAVAEQEGEEKDQGKIADLIKKSYAVYKNTIKSFRGKAYSGDPEKGFISQNWGTGNVIYKMFDREGYNTAFSIMKPMVKGDKFDDPEKLKQLKKSLEPLVNPPDEIGYKLSEDPRSSLYERIEKYIN